MAATWTTPRSCTPPSSLTGQWRLTSRLLTLVRCCLIVDFGFRTDDPGLPLLLFLLLVGIAVLGLLMVVMRALLRQATTLRTATEAVI
jgi:CHASE1-domain containing sensor protein